MGSVAIHKPRGQLSLSGPQGTVVTLRPPNCHCSWDLLMNTRQQMLISKGSNVKEGRGALDVPMYRASVSTGQASGGNARSLGSREVKDRKKRNITCVREEQQQQRNWNPGGSKGSGDRPLFMCIF